jgi:hypothetical protein
MRIKSLMKCTAVLLLLIAGVFFCLSHGQSRTKAPVDRTFSFWYEPWQTGVTINKLQDANIIIGVPPAALSEIHQAGKRGLQYVTYYQTGFKTAFLKDGDDLSNVGFNAGSGFEKSAFGGKDNYVLCPNSVELKARVLRYLDGSMKEGVDGYFIDNSFIDPSAHEVCVAPHSHIQSGAQGGRAYVALLSAVREKMKQQNPSAILITNPGSPVWSDKIDDGTPSLWDVSDYVLWESYGYTSHSGPRHDRWKQTLEQSFVYAAAPNKARKVLALSYPQTISEARFAYAVAKIFGFTWTANLGEKQQGKNEDGGHFGVFLNQFPFELGDPVSSLPDKSSRLLHRTFSRGEVFVNTGMESERIPIAKGATIYAGDSAPEKGASAQLTLPSMTAVFVLNQR